MVCLRMAESVGAHGDADSLVDDVCLPRLSAEGQLFHPLCRFPRPSVSLRRLTMTLLRPPVSLLARRRRCCCRADWLLRCMAEGKLLPDAPFRVVRSQKLGMDNFFSSGDASSEKEKRREGGKRMLPGTPATGGSKERRRGEGRGRHREKGRPELAAAAATAAAAAATSSSTSNRNVRGRGAPTVGPGTSSSTFCTKGDVGRTCSGRGSGSYSSSSSCKENGDAVGAAAPPDRGSSNKDSIRHLSEVAQEESGLHSSRSNHATAARKRSRDNPTPSPALKAEGTVRGECHDLIGDDALPSSPSNAHKRQQRPSRHEER